MKRDCYFSAMMTAVLLMTALLTACDSAPEPRAPEEVRGSYVGRLDSSDALVAFVTRDSKALAYVCNSADVSEWLRGEVSDGKFDLTSEGGAHLRGSVSKDVTQGTFSLNDRTSRTFNAAPASGEAGLYRARDTIDGVEYTGGWIVLPDGAQAGAVSGGGKLRPAPKLSPGDVVINVPNIGKLVPQLVNPIIDKTIGF